MNVFAHNPADPAAALPTVVSLDVACTWAKTSPDDPEVAALIKAAMVRVEDFCQQPIFNREFIANLRGFQSGTFDSLLVTEVVSVQYRIKGASEFTILPAEHYDYFENDLCFLDSVSGFPNVDRVRIRFKAGYVNVPESIIQAIKLLVAGGYDNRADAKQAVQTQAETWLKPHRLPHS